MTAVLGSGVGDALASTTRRARSLATEAAWLGAHVVGYPAGLLRSRLSGDVGRLGLDGLTPDARGRLVGNVAATSTPVVLVHGIIDNHTVFTRLRRDLRRRGFERTAVIDYGPFAVDIRRLARRLGEDVERICAGLDVDRVHVVGHSLGGLVARYYVQRLRGDARVETLVTLGTPHSGTVRANLLPHPLLRQLRPGSDLFTELDAPAPSCSTRFVAVWSDTDHVVVPRESARLDHPDLAATNVLVPNVGHMSLSINARVAHAVAGGLAPLS